MNYFTTLSFGSLLAGLGGFEISLGFDYRRGIGEYGRKGRCATGFHHGLMVFVGAGVIGREQK